MPKKSSNNSVGAYTAGRLIVLSLGIIEEAPATESASAAVGIYGLQSSSGLRVAFVPKEYANSEGSANELARRWNSWEPGGEISQLLLWVGKVNQHRVQELAFAQEMNRLPAVVEKITRILSQSVALSRKTNRSEPSEEEEEPG